MKKIAVIWCCILIIISLVGCSKAQQPSLGNLNNNNFNKEYTDNPLVGRWQAYTNVGHLIENTYGYENVDFYVTCEYCFNEDHTFSFKISDVNEDELTEIFIENNISASFDTIQEQIETTKTALYYQTDRGTYSITGNTLILHGIGELELDITINSSTNITLTKDQKSLDLNYIATK